MNKPIYNGQKLQDDEYLLKVDDNGVGFLTKLTKKGELPKAFDEWREYFMSNSLNERKKSPKLPIYIHKEEPSVGWKLENWRIGQSQEWATIRHPEGFTIEIYLDNFLQIVKTDSIINGYISGKYIWKDHKLTKNWYNGSD